VAPKTHQKLQAIKLRKMGLSYSEILKKIQVSQSSLSLWLHGIKLTKFQELRLKRKGNKARKLGSEILKGYRISKSRKIINDAALEINTISKNNLMLIGTALYWAEGSKQKEHKPSKEVIFSNSDSKMIQLYLKWLERCLKIPSERIVFEIYIHETYKKTVLELASFWSKITGFPVSKFRRVYFKKNKVHSFRKNRGLEYGGV